MAGAGVVGDERGRAAHPGVLLDARRDLLQLDAVAAQFDLVVGTADELQCAVRVPQAHVTGAVEALARGERRVHEPFRGLLGAPEVAARQLDSAQVKFTALADVHGRAVGVEDVGAEAVDGDADRDGRAGAAAEGVGVDLVGGGVDGGLGRAVQVDQETPGSSARRSRASRWVRASPPEKTRSSEVQDANSSVSSRAWSSVGTHWRVVTWPARTAVRTASGSRWMPGHPSPPGRRWRGRGSPTGRRRNSSASSATP